MSSPGEVRRIRLLKAFILWGPVMFVQNVMLILQSVVGAFPSQPQMLTSWLHSRKSQMICKLNFLFVSKKKFFLSQACSTCDSCVSFSPPASFSELLLLALAIGGGITALVFLLIIILSCRRCKKRRQRDGDKEDRCKERKDPTVW